MTCVVNQTAVGRLVSLLAVGCGVLASGCQPTGRSVRAWIESRTADGNIVAGATVTIDGQPLGMTDQRGLFRLKIRRSVGTRVAVSILDETPDPDTEWIGSFTVGTNGMPVEFAGGRIIAVLDGAP